jgi:hypothetical protein
MMIFIDKDGARAAGDSYTAVLNALRDGPWSLDGTSGEWMRAVAHRVHLQTGGVIDTDTDETFIRSLEAAGLIRDIGRLPGIRCSTCRYCLIAVSGPATCHRNPPIPASMIGLDKTDDYANHGWWPEVFPQYGGCGEHRPRSDEWQLWDMETK